MKRSGRRRISAHATNGIEANVVKFAAWVDQRRAHRPVLRFAPSARFLKAAAMRSNVSEIIERIDAVVADERVPAKERLDAVIEIAEALEAHEDKLNLSLSPES